MTGVTSTSLTRLPSAASAFVRGKFGNSPFLPGGLDDAVKSGGVDSISGSVAERHPRLREDAGIAVTWHWWRPIVKEM